jgi:hypothetical protein
MHRIVSASLVMMVLFLGVGSYVDAQTCPDISGEWTFELSSISYCTGPGVPNGPYFPVWKIGTWTFTPVSEDKCFFWAIRHTADSNSNRFDNTDSYFTGIIRPGGKKITMEIQPDYINNPGTIFGTIIKSNRRTGMPTEIEFEGTAHIGDYSPGAQGTSMQCAISSRGCIKR